MSRSVEEVSRCDKCSNTPDAGYSIRFLSCGHDICSRHLISDGYGNLTCPICAQRVTIGRKVGGGT